MSDQTIDLGVDFNDVKDMDQFPVLPNGNYDFTILKIESKQTTGGKTPGRPQLKWTLGFHHPETGQKLQLFYNTVLPWIPPGQSELDISGVGMLVALCKEVGLPWAGRTIDPGAYLGRSGKAVVSQEKKNMKDASGNWVPDPNGKVQNKIDGMLSNQ